MLILRFSFWLCHPVCVRLWTDHLTFLHLVFLFKVTIMKNLDGLVRIKWEIYHIKWESTPCCTMHGVQILILFQILFLNCLESLGKCRWPRWTCIILCMFAEHSEWWHGRFSLPSAQMCPHNPYSLLSLGLSLPISDILGRVHTWEVVSKKRLQRFDGTLRKLLTAQSSWQDRDATDSHQTQLESVNFM